MTAEMQAAINTLLLICRHMLVVWKRQKARLRQQTNEPF